MASRPLPALQVVGIRYYSDRSAADEPNCLDSYAAADVYGAAGVPLDVIEPAFPEDQRADDPATNTGILGGCFRCRLRPGNGPRRRDECCLRLRAPAGGLTSWRKYGTTRFGDK